MSSPEQQAEEAPQGGALAGLAAAAAAMESQKEKTDGVLTDNWNALAAMWGDIKVTNIDDIGAGAPKSDPFAEMEAAVEADAEEQREAEAEADDDAGADAGNADAAGSDDASDWGSD